MIKLLSLADSISITNAIFGVLAILFLISDLDICEEYRLRISVTFIFLALLIDGLDGIVARRTGKSNIGEYLESMADMTSMIIAPSAFIFYIYSTSDAFSIFRFIYIIIALTMFLSFGIIRLASFHIMKEDKYFIGLPASASTILLVILSYFKVDFIYILPTVIIIGALMISDIKYPKPRIRINSIATILIFLTIILDKNFSGIFPIILFIAILLYAIGGPVYYKFFTKKR
jgi:CDP-diacylglycerol--serine O-phosphatidyltransferase